MVSTSQPDRTEPGALAFADTRSQQLKLLVVAAVGAAAVATPEAAEPRDAAVVERATCVYTCGTVCYWQEDIDEALAEGYKDLKAGSAPGTLPCPGRFSGDLGEKKKKEKERKKTTLV